MPMTWTRGLYQRIAWALCGSEFEGVEHAGHQEERLGQHVPDVAPGRPEAVDHAVHRAEAEADQPHQQEAVEDPRDVERHHEVVVEDDEGVDEHPGEEHREEVGDELRDHRVEGIDHRIGEQAAIAGDRLADRPGHVAEQVEGDDAGGVEEREVGPERRLADGEAEGRGQQQDAADGLGDRPEVAAPRPAELGRHLAHDQGEEHPQPLQRDPGPEGGRPGDDRRRGRRGDHRTPPLPSGDGPD